MNPIAQTPFAACDAHHYGIAVDEITSKFPKDVPKRMRSAHETVAQPWQAALRGHASPSLVARTTIYSPESGELTLIGMGKKIYPVFVAEGKWGERRLALFEPVKAEDVKLGKLQTDKLEAVYGKEWKRAERILLKRSSAGPTTDVQGNDAPMLHDQSYGWALWESAAMVLRIAEVSAKRSADAYEKKKKGADAFDLTTRTLGAKVASLVDKKAVRDRGGPPVGLAHDLLAAGTVANQAVLLTSQRDGEAPVRLWLETEVDGKRVYNELPLPKGGAVRGVGMVVAGDTVKLIGGLDDKGKPTSAIWELDVRRVQARGFRPDMWTRGNDLEKPVAWPTVAYAGGTLYVLGGVAGFQSQSHKKDALLLPATVRTMYERDRGRWLELSPVPTEGEAVGSCTAAVGNAFAVGPGNSCSGKVYLYTAAQGGRWHVLPQLPEKLGLGQVFFDGDYLVYSGGFTGAGKASKSIYRIDLNSYPPEWELVGESPYVAGLARLVESQGELLSVMVRPEATATFQLA